jgi:hypothetical protein
MLQLVSALLFAEKTLPVARELLIQQNQHAIDMHPFGVAASVVASVSYLITCGMTVLAVVCLDVLFKDSGRLERLAEFTGLTFISQIPYWGLMVIAGCLWSPEPILVPIGASVSEVRVAVQEWREDMFRWPLLAASRVISYYSLIWQVALIAVCLRVVSRLSARAVLFASGILLALLLFIQVIASHH